MMFSSASFQAPVQVLQPYTLRPGKSRPPQGPHGPQSSVRVLAWSPESVGPEAEHTSSGLVGEPAARARMGVTQTPAFLPAQGLSVVLKRIMYGFHFSLFFKQSFFSFFFFLKCKKTPRYSRDRHEGRAGGLHAGACIGCCRFVI